WGGDASPDARRNLGRPATGDRRRQLVPDPGGGKSPVNLSPIAQEYLDKGHSTTCPIIDMHGHVGPFYGCYLPSSPLDRMRHRLKRCGVQRIVCSHHSALACDVERGNALMQQVVTAHPDEFLAYWVINPHYPQITSRDLRSFGNLRGFVGLKFWPD